MSEIKTATASTVARENIEQVTSYHKMDNPSSRLKEKIGCLLLCLLTGNAQPSGWKIFDRLLRRLYAEGLI
jgi:hypothetical protein